MALAYFGKRIALLPEVTKIRFETFSAGTIEL
jgi:hypothetical protein